MDRPNKPLHALPLLASASIRVEPPESGRSPSPPPKLMPMTLDLTTPDACDFGSARREGEGRILPDLREEREDGTYRFRVRSMLSRLGRARPLLPRLERAWPPPHTPAKRPASLLPGCYTPASLLPATWAPLATGLGEREREGRGGRGVAAVHLGLQGASGVAGQI